MGHQPIHRISPAGHYLLVFADGHTSASAEQKYRAALFSLGRTIPILGYVSPVPKGANTYIEEELHFSDGSRKVWTYPRMEQMSLKEKLFKERYRKFADILQRDELDDLLPDAARYIARLNSTSENPIKTVILIQRLAFIVPRPDDAYVPEPWQSHILLGYGVRPEDLK